MKKFTVVSLHRFLILYTLPEESEGSRAARRKSGFSPLDVAGSQKLVHLFVISCRGLLKSSDIFIPAQTTTKLISNLYTLLRIIF